MKQRLLLVEDTSTLQLIYSANLTQAGYAVDVASTGQDGLQMFSNHNHPVVIMDLFLPDADGVEIIQKLMRINSNAKIIVITSNGSVNRAVEAMRAGAFDFLLKPFSDDRLLNTVSSALSSIKPSPAVDLNAGNFYGFTGRGKLMKEMYHKIMRIAPSTAPVFIIGERGVGKEVCAKAIHSHSGADARPFITFNGSDLNANEQEVALFGGVADSDPRNNTNNVGVLEKAFGGTLFISEISEIDPNVQSKFATYIHNFDHDAQQALSDESHFPRIICSTSIDPYLLLETRKIREDLFYQLHILTLDIHPLRDLGTDILFIAQTLLERFSRSEKKAFVGFSEEVSQLFLIHKWPGNVNQLKNLLHKIVASFDSDVVSQAMLPIGFTSIGQETKYKNLVVNDDRFINERSNNAIHQLVGLPLDEVERKFIEATIRSQGGSIPKAAEVLGVAPSTIYRKNIKA